MTDTTVKTTRAQRMAMPLARQVVKDLAVEHGACIRPVQLRRTSLDTGEVDQVLVPCGHTLAHVCRSCAERARTLRAAQCREGWHLEDEPDLAPGPATDDQKFRIQTRAEAQQLRDQAATAGQDTTDLDELLTELDEEITNAGIRGKVTPAKPARRHRSTRRRQDTPDLPTRKISPRTVGKTYTAPDGKTFRPSLFVTLTCPSYGRVGGCAVFGHAAVGRAGQGDEQGGAEGLAVRRGVGLAHGAGADLAAGQVRGVLAAPGSALPGPPGARRATRRTRRSKWPTRPWLGACEAVFLVDPRTSY